MEADVKAEIDALKRRVQELEDAINELRRDLKKESRDRQRGFRGLTST